MIDDQSRPPADATPTGQPDDTTCPGDIAPAPDTGAPGQEATAPHDATTTSEGWSTEPQAKRWATRWLEVIARRVGMGHVVRVAKRSRHLRAWLDQLPARMHLVANQTQLILALVDDFRSGAYREVPWRSIAVAAGALLYVISPIDVVPDVLAGLGVIDDLAVLAAAARLMRTDLENYCQFKGYDPEKYFGAHS